MNFHVVPNVASPADSYTSSSTLYSCCGRAREHTQLSLIWTSPCPDGHTYAAQTGNMVLFKLSFQNVRMNAYAPVAPGVIVLIDNAWQPVFDKNTY
jgi:hypothetical protein